ncbi:MAG: T9SS type A sorting domain-containing protein [Bacteroidales bacterium]|nr:T9SS type A sorting domain-containing protein [Bacteroidales bacterium]
MKKRFLPLSMLLITIVLAQASFVANATGTQGKYTPRTASEATLSSFMKIIRANQETGLIDPADLIAGQKSAQTGTKDANLEWTYAGPDNFGGLTRAIVYNTDGTVIIGTMGGDIYQTTNGGITFRKKTSMNLPISCMVADENGNIYIGTGDGRGAQAFNGLEVLGYEASFIGKGMYKMAAGSFTPELLEATTPTATNGWGYINELAYTNGKIYAATDGGIMMSADNGTSWTNVLEGSFRSVKVNGAGDVMAADNEDVYLSVNGAAFNNVSDGIASNSNPKIIAMSPSDANFMYIAFLTGSAGAYKTGNLYFSQDRGNTWQIGVYGTNNQGACMYEMFGSDAQYDGYMIVYPNNPRKLFVGSDNLWIVEDKTAQGVNSYRPQQISEYMTDEYTAIAWNRYYYLHQGIQTIAFNPTNSNVFFVGTNGGVYKGEYYADAYSYRSSNRYFLTEDEHTSVARMMNVAVGGMDMILGGCLDHGTIFIGGSDDIDNPTTGSQVFPHITNNSYVSTYFNKKYAGGPCAMSTIDPYIFFVSGTGSITTPTGSISTPIYRTQTAGVDYDQNFEGGDSPVITNANAFKTPFAFFETYNDSHSSTNVSEILDRYELPVDTLPVVDTLYINDTVFVANGTIGIIENDSVFYYQYFNVYDPTATEDSICYRPGAESCYVYYIMHDYLYTETIDLDTLVLGIRRNAKAGDIVNYYSVQGNYPISYTLPEPPHDAQHVDPQGGYMWVEGDTIRGLHDPLKTTYVCAVEGEVYITRDALVFNRATEWFPMSTITGIPTAVAMTSDGTTAFVGTAEGSFYTFTHLNDVFTAEQADVTNTLNPCVEMTEDVTTFAGRAITSISVNPANNNKVIVTLGNYGNTDYVYISNNGGTSFTAATGLPAIPVYSSVIEKSTGLYIVGTECGIYTSENGTSWAKSGEFSCPIMDLKQAWMENHDAVIDELYDDAGNVTYVIYPGIYNEGMLYAASYGAGLLKCGTYKEGGDLGVVENEVTENSVQLNIYPNPVKENGNINITLTEGANVSYQIYDLSGRMVANSELGYYGQGEQTLTFNVSDLTSGSYIIRLQAGSKSETAKFLVY